MKITYEGDYTLKILFELALNYDKKTDDGEIFYIKVKDIAIHQNIPFKYLQQIILKLKMAGYVKTKAGQNGGVALAKSPDLIRLGDIVRFSEGTTAPVTCVSSEPGQKTNCEDEKSCVFKEVWQEVRDRINQVVDGITFKDLVERYKSRLKNGDYYYEI